MGLRSTAFSLKGYDAVGETEEHTPENHLPAHYRLDRLLEALNNMEILALTSDPQLPISARYSKGYKNSEDKLEREPSLWK